MTGTLRILRSEFDRLIRSLSLWIVGVTVGAVAAVSALTSSIQILGQGSVESGGGWACMLDGMRTGLALTVFALLVTSARSLAGDHESGLLRMAVTRSVARPALVMGRLLVAPLPILGGLLASFLGAWLVARSQLDFGPLVEEGYEILSAEELRGEVAVGLFATLPALVALWSVGLLVSACSRTAVGAVATTLVLFVAFDLVKESLSQESTYLIFASFAPSLADSSALGEAAQVVQGFSDRGFPDDLLRLATWLPWAQALLIVGLTIAVPRRRTL